MFSAAGGKRFCGTFGSIIAAVAALKVEQQEPQPKEDELKLKKEMAKQNAQIEELQKEFMASQQKMATEFIGKLRTILTHQAPIHHKMASRFGFGNPPKGNGWRKSGWFSWNSGVEISSDGLYAKVFDRWQKVIAQKGFPVPRGLYRKDNFPGTILYYFEVSQMSYLSSDWGLYVGLSDGSTDYKLIGSDANSYALLKGHNYSCYLSDKCHDFEWPKGAIRPEWKGLGDIVGCGLLLDLNNKLSIFFTVNGTLMGKPIQISPTSERLFPAVSMMNVFVEANFGGNPEKPFKYDINKCPGLIFDD